MCISRTEILKTTGHDDERCIDGGRVVHTPTQGRNQISIQEEARLPFPPLFLFRLSSPIPLLSPSPPSLPSLFPSPRSFPSLPLLRSRPYPPLPSPFIPFPFPSPS